MSSAPVLLLLLLSQAACQCTFPSDLTGAWVRGRDVKTLTFTSSRVTGLGVTNGADTLDSFDCHLSSGSSFVLRSTNTFTSGTTKYLYMCLNLHQVNSNSFYAYELTGENAAFGNERVQEVLSSTPVTVATVCTENTATAPFFSLIREGSETAAKEQCPDVLLGRYTYVYNDGTSTSCGSGPSHLDVCTDKTSPTFDYTLCAPFMLGSQSGVLNCVGTVTSPSTTFVLLYNTDATLFNNITFRFTCVAVAQGSNSSRMSQRPHSCLPSMSPSTVPPGGGTFVLSHLADPETTTTVDTTTSPASDGLSPTTLAALIGGVLGGLLLVAMAIAVAVAGAMMLLGAMGVIAFVIAGDKLPLWTAGTGPWQGLPSTYPILNAWYRPSATPLVPIRPMPHSLPYKDYVGVHGPSIHNQVYTLQADAPAREAQITLGRNSVPPVHHHYADLSETSAYDFLSRSDSLPHSVPPESLGHEYIMRPVPRNPYEIL